MTTANFYVLTNPLQPEQGLKERNGVATAQAPSTLPKAKAEPEVRLWKLCAAVVSPRFSVFEWSAFLFLLFGVLSLGALACCFSELVQLLSSGALDRTINALLTR